MENQINSVFDNNSLHLLDNQVNTNWKDDLKKLKKENITY